MNYFKRQASHLLAWYGTVCPAHKGKWRVLNLAIKYGNLQSGYPSPVVVTRGGSKMELDLNSYVEQLIYYHGGYETWDTKFFQNVIQPDWVMFDVGVNIGWYSLMASQKIAPPGRIYAFDILESELRKFRRNLELNQITFVEPILMAITDAPGRVSISVSDNQNAGQTSLAVGGKTGKEVEATSLDVFTAQRKITRLDIIKADIEGAEVKFLSGGTNALKLFQPILIMELSPNNLERFGQKVETPVALLQGLGYRLFRSNRRGLAPLGALPRGEEYFNIIALPSRLANDNAPQDWEAVARLGIATSA